MTRLEDMIPGCILSGIAPGTALVRVVEIHWQTDACLTITCMDDRGRTTVSTLTCDEAEVRAVTVVDPARPWSFTGNSADFVLAAEAWRMRHAWLFDPFLAVHTCDVDPLPHQIDAVYGRMLPLVPLRFVLADDPGAGKTIMTGLLIREMLARGDLERCLIVCPGSLAAQWREELLRRFNLHFETVDDVRSAKDVFAGKSLVVARLDRLARNNELLEALEKTDWDLVVCDEAHKMSATVHGGEIHATRRFRLGRLLSSVARNFLLLTATPHNGRNEDFRLFLSLLDPDRFGGVAGSGAGSLDVTDIMRRLVKEQLLDFDGRPLFPERYAYTVSYELSPEERELYEAVTDYVRTQFNRADSLAGERRTTVGFALTVLQRRLASSPEAIYRSLTRRRERLEKRLEEARTTGFARSERCARNADGRLQSVFEGGWDEDECPEEDLERAESFADGASAARTLAELEAETEVLKSLEALAERVRNSGRDRKWTELANLLQDNRAMFDRAGEREKLIIFTEHRDTLTYIMNRISSLLGDAEAVVHIDGSMSRRDRLAMEDRFKNDPKAVVLVATDAAGEGLNLQRAHLVINYDLPWNPNRLEQRFGRVHRIGQKHVCGMWNLVAAETREGHVFQRLFEKLEEERKALGGRVFDILGSTDFGGRPLRDLIIEAVRAEGDADAPIPHSVAVAMDDALHRSRLEELLDKNALTDDVMDVPIAARIRADMDRMEARRLQPFFVQAFFGEAFARLGGLMEERERGRWEIVAVPSIVRARCRVAGTPVPGHYERVCFERARREGDVRAEFLCPGHPLLEAVVDLVLERFGSALTTGAVLVDERENGDEGAKLLVLVANAVVEGRSDQDGCARTLSKQAHFLEVDEKGNVVEAGAAPHLDYRPATWEQGMLALAYAAAHKSLFGDEARALALRFAREELVPRHLRDVQATREELADRKAKAVRLRMDAEIRYWDARAYELDRKARKEDGDGTAALEAQRARCWADDLAERKKKRLENIALEREVSALEPEIAGCCLLVPTSLLRRLAVKPDESDPEEAKESAGNESEVLPCPDAAVRKAVELAAMAAVMETERTLGNEPVDVSAARCGYDIESRPGGGGPLRLIEVKGRAAGHGDTVNVTRNEVIAALNKPEQFILAVVFVDRESIEVVYLQSPFRNQPDLSANYTNYNVEALIAAGSMIHRSTILHEGTRHAPSKEAH